MDKVRGVLEEQQQHQQHQQHQNGPMIPRSPTIASHGAAQH
jgi:hypothetical protein